MSDYIIGRAIPAAPFVDPALHRLERQACSCDPMIGYACTIHSDILLIRQERIRMRDCMKAVLVLLQEQKTAEAIERLEKELNQ